MTIPIDKPDQGGLPARSTNGEPDDTSQTSMESSKGSSAGSIKKTVRDKAQDLAHDAKQTAKSHADTAKSSVADEISDVGTALRSAAEDMRSGSAAERTFGQIAEGLADASDAVRDKDLGTMVQDVGTFARKNPLVFIGGAVLVGFAAARFAKASERSESKSSVSSRSVPTSRGEFS